jgi:hypothetical protein
MWLSGSDKAIDQANHRSGNHRTNRAGHRVTHELQTRVLHHGRSPTYFLIDQSRHRLDRRDEPVAMLRHRLNIPWCRRAVVQRPSQGADRLGQRFVGDRNAAPDHIHEPIFRNEGAVRFQKKDQGV